MNSTHRKEHWDNIYTSKQTNELSWYQEVPSTSIEFVKELNLPVTAKIFDNGCGESYFVDYMLNMGYENITVLDISEAAIKRTKDRLQEKSGKVKWIIADQAKCNSTEKFDLWHDRAAFHFLTDEAEIKSYIQSVKNCVKPGGYFILGTFSENGPKKCSGLDITQYSEKSMIEKFGPYFELIKCVYTDHVTPAGVVQNFIFCCFKRKDI